MSPSRAADWWVRRASAAVLVGAALYTVVRAIRLKLDYYDAFLYLHNASRLAGHDVGVAVDDSRPWLLSVVQTPVVLVARLLGPGNAWLLRGPHLVITNSWKADLERILGEVSHGD